MYFSERYHNSVKIYKLARYKFYILKVLYFTSVYILQLFLKSELLVRQKIKSCNNPFLSGDKVVRIVRCKKKKSELCNTNSELRYIPVIALGKSLNCGFTACSQYVF